MIRRVIFGAALVIVASAAVLFLTREQPGKRAAPRGFVTTNGARFEIDGEPFRFTGANVAVIYGDDERENMPQTFREAAQDGLSVVRIWASGESGADDGTSAGVVRGTWLSQHPFRRGPEDWNEEAFVNLDRIIAEAAGNNLRVQICLGNWWRDTGGVVRYLRWVGVADAADDTQPFGINLDRAMLFYTNEDARRLYREHVNKIVTRRNSVTGTLYADDPTIMSYELMNEAQAATGRWQERRAWIAEMSRYIKSLDPNHLIAPGTWGYRTSWERREWLLDHQLPTIDYCDVHLYPRDDLNSYVDSPAALREFIDNRVAAAISIKKPLVFGEFGIPAEGYNGSSQIEWFHAFFDGVLQSGAGGAVYWILTHDAQRVYGITYTVRRDEQLRAEIHSASE
ncbi:MAG TPA: cellulase family glycosylhydrolase, partial [Pyrinomonadaceae bacterium]|nr:cellulase family glycosylhydrolase [Pyrinomonadaceae bacterium]